MEDLLEEIVGEIYDEYDEAEPLPEAAEDGVTLPGDMELEDLTERYDLDIPEEHYLTIGGYVFGQLGRLPQVGDRVSVAGVRLEVLEMAGRRVGKLRMVREGGKAKGEKAGGQA
jgi:putative hemolysin